MLQSFYILFVVGMNDANMGIIIPSIKSHYGVSQSVVSIIFLCVTAGNFFGAFINGYLVQKTSQKVTATIGAAILFVGLFICIFGVPFPAMCVAQVIVGCGTALSDASTNVICGEMPRATMILNFLHAVYGVGALVAPLIAAAVLDHSKPWTITYIYLAGLAFLNIALTGYFFRNLKTRAERERQSDGDGNRRAKRNLIREATMRKTTVLGAAFILFYMGAEVALGDWGYTFLITVRSTDTVMMAQIMSAYWAGLCARRLFLAYWTLKFGEKRMVYFYLGITLGVLFIFWFVPNVGASATALAILGIAIGPIYPTAISVANKTIPVRLYAVSIGFIAAFGSGGAALFPYITGVLIGVKGVANTLAPLIIAMTVTMIALWVFVPNPTKVKKETEDISSSYDVELAESDTQHRRSTLS
ncbi:major facilitator superfamily domain-containing protein [Fennellomyces sp. T-0311]|nr:major facilitator superfamily domain-containing protein [Fennellomyces sp. T-0311]